MAMYPKLFGILKLQKDYSNRNNNDGDDEDFVDGATTTSSQAQDDGESLSETAQSRTPSPNNTNATTPIQSPSLCSTPDPSTPQPPPSLGEPNDDGKTQDYESGNAVIKQEIMNDNDSQSNGATVDAVDEGRDRVSNNNNNNNNISEESNIKNVEEALPKLRLNTMLASDPALKPEAKDIKDMRASTEDNSNDGKNDDGFHNNIDHDMDIKEIRLIKERSNNIIVPPPIIASPSLDATPRMQVFMCSPCGIRFSSLSTLEAHQTYYCSHRKDADENVAPQKPSANNDSGGSEPPNKSIKTGKQYACTQCSYSADKKVSLNRHMRMHQTSPAPSPTTTNGGLVVVSAGTSLLNVDDTLSIPSQIQQQQQQQQLAQQNQVQQIDRYCSDCDIRFSSTKTYRAHKQHYCSSRHRDENRSNSTTPKPPSIKRGSQSPPDAQPVAKSPAVANPPPNPVQPYLALPTNPIIIVPYTFIRNASVLTGPLASIPTSVTNPESTCFIFQNGALQPIAVALSPPIPQPTQQAPIQNTSPRGPTPNQTISNENSNNTSNNSETVLKVSNKRDISARETITTPLDLSVRRLSPGSNPRERAFSFSSIASLENHRIDMDSIMEAKENLSMGGSESITPEQIVCAPSLPGSPPLTPSPKRRSNSPRGGTTSVSPNNSLPSSGSSQHQVVLRSLIPPELALRLSESSALAAMPAQALAKQNLELSLRLSSAGSNSEISPQPTPPLISIIPNPATSSTPSAVPPQIFVKQGVSKCKECNIVFCKYENYLAHKKHYCSARNLEDTENSKPSPPVSPQATSPSGSGALAYQQLICAACGIKFTSLDNLSAHQLYYCPKRVDISMSVAKESRCNKCKNIHETGAPCPNNVSGIGTGGNPSNRKCPICDVVASTSNELRKHMETHGGVKAFRCTICRYKGNTLRGMRTHIRMHFDKKTSDFNEENYISCILDEDGIEIPAQPLLAISQAPPVIPPPPPPSMPIIQDALSSQQVHYCDLCNYSSSFKANVIRHINLAHATNRPPLSPTLGEGGESLLFNGDLQSSPAQLQFNSAKTAQPTNNLMNEVSVKQEPMDEPQLIEDSRDGILTTEPEILIKTEIKDTMDTSMSIMPPLIQTTTQQHSASSSPDLQSLTTAGPKYCKQCDIKFNYLSTFIAHKQFYCKSGIQVGGVDRDSTGTSPTQSANNNNNNNVVVRATEASVL